VGATELANHLHFPFSFSHLMPLDSQFESLPISWLKMNNEQLPT